MKSIFKALLRASMKMISTPFLSVILIGMVASAGSFPLTKSERVNQRLQACLDKYGCRVTAHAGVCRDEGASGGAGRSATSCHLSCRAIDITSVSCTKSGKKSNRENLAVLRDCLSGFFYTACYGGKGTCHADHMDHLHFGGKEIFGCP